MTDFDELIDTTEINDLIHRRHSERVLFDPDRPVADSDLRTILEAARWAPTAHNMQNFEIIVVDDKAILTAIGRVRSGASEEFIRENFAQLSFTEDELIRKRTGLIATMFPPSWHQPEGTPEASDVEHGFLDATMRSCPVVVVVVFDTRQRAPGSEGDFLGIMSLGCVMQNMWLTAEALGIGMQIMSVFSTQHVEEDLRTILSIPEHIKIAFACRLGYPLGERGRYLRVRREIQSFTHHNAFGAGAFD